MARFFIFFGLGLICLALIFSLGWQASQDDKVAIVSTIVTALLGVALFWVATSEFESGYPALPSWFLEKNAIYEVVANIHMENKTAKDILTEKWWVVLRDQHGDCRLYGWKGIPPKGIVKAIRKPDAENGFDLLPFPLTTTS